MSQPLEGQRTSNEPYYIQIGQQSPALAHEEYNPKAQMYMRIGWAIVFLACLISTMFNVERVDVITPDECLRDQTFIWTAPLNAYLAANRDLTDRYIIFCSFLMDFMLITAFVLWFLYGKSFRLLIAYMLFFGIRGVIQVMPFS